MARDKRKTRAQDTGPAQPRWRRPPTRSRHELRRMRSVTRPVAKPASKPAASRAPARPGLRLPTRSAGLEIARRVLTLILAAALTFGLAELLRLPQLAVSRTSTQIGGVQRITRQQIYDASGIEGRSIFLIRPSEVAAAVTQIGGIAAAQVHVRLPNQVLIDVQEYVPLVAWQGITTTLWLSAEGAAVPQTGPLPPLTLKDPAGALPKDGRPLRPELLKNLAVLRDARPDVTEVTYSENSGLAFRTPEGCEVWLGDSGPLADKLALLDVTRQEISKLGRQARVIDLRYSSQRAIWW